MVNTYKLVNPFIQGDFNDKVKAVNSLEAAKEFYGNLSEHFNNNVPKFYFTIQKGSSGKGKYYHFLVEEKRSKDNVSFSIEPYKVRGEADSNKSFAKKLKKFKGRMELEGGAKKKSKKSKKRKSSKRRKSKSKDDSSSEEYIKKELSYVPVADLPIHHWWYDPSLYKVNSVYIPTFYSYVTPYIEVVSTLF